MQNLVYSGSASGLTLASTYGYSFTVGSEPITITALGMWDRYDDGFAGLNQVALWNTAGDMLASATIQSGTGSPLADHFRYEVITPQELSANTTYYLGVHNVSGDSFYTDTSYAIASVVSPTLAGGYYMGYGAPNILSATVAIGPNALYTAVPEPSAYAVLFGLAASGFAAYRRRQKRPA